MTRAYETSNPSFNHMMHAQSLDSTGSTSLTQTIALPNDEYAVSVSEILRSSSSSRLMVQSWFLNGPQGLSSTYYADCYWSVPIESLLTSIPLFRPIDSAVMNDQGSKVLGSTYPCSVQWSGLLRIPKAFHDADVSFELGSNRGSCLTLFINDRICCGTCHSVGFHRNRYGRDLNQLPCKCRLEARGSLVSEFWRLSLYGNSDGGSPGWFLNWFSVNAHSEGFQPIQDSDILPSSTFEHNVAVFSGM
jgi:hypothetical protein